MIRIRRLDLDFFGQFSGKSYDFGPRPQGTPDFHLIHGPNEAGKTTTMEGFLRLLYGFPHREPYAFQHDRKTLRVSAVLENGDGERAFTRLPTRGANLVDPAGQPLPEQALSAHLGGLGQEDYRNLLCLDDETIERGGEEIASAKGDIGRLLFSAAAGISDLSGVLGSVRDRADALYKKRSSKTRMAGLRAEMKEIDRRIREEDISASAYRSLRQARDTALRDEETIKQEREGVAQALATTRTRQAALPLLAEIDRLETFIDAHPGFPERLDIDPEDLVAMLSDHSRAEADITRLGAEIDKLTETAEGITRHPEDLALIPRLERLDDLRSRYVTAEKDLPKRRASLAEVTADMARAARDLGAPDDIDPGVLVVPQNTLDQLEALRDKLREARRATRAANEELAQDVERLAAARDAQDADADHADPDIGAILDRFSADTLAQRHAAATQAVAGAERQMVEACDALFLKGQRFVELPVCPLAPEEVAQLAETHAQLDSEMRRLEATISDLETEAADIAAQIASLDATGTLPGDDAAQAMMAERDMLWQRHRTELTAKTADLFETAMRQVDDAAQTRLNRARDLGQLRELAETAGRIERRKTKAAKERNSRMAERDAAAQELTAAARACGISAPVLAPGFTAWVQRLAEAHAAQQRLERIRAEHAPVFDQAAGLSDALAPHLDLVNADFATLLAAARRKAEEARERQAAVRSARERIKTLEAARDRQKNKLLTCQKAEATALSAWQEALDAALGDALTTDADLLPLAPLRKLRELDQPRGSLTRQIKAMEADQDAFTTEVIALTGVTELSDPLAAFSALRDKADAARKAEDQHAQVADDIRQRQEALNEARQRLNEIASRHRDLAAVFPATAATATLQDLRKSVALARELIDARRECNKHLAQLCTTLDMSDLDAARRALADHTVAGLDARMMELQSDLDAVEGRYHAAIAERSAADRDLTAVTGDADIALLTERKATVELEMQEVALDFLKLQLGHTLAEEAIRRYRDVHRSGMMKATETAFAELTNGAYTRLLTQPDGNAEVLIALDPAGNSKQAQDMSKGTRFQLYLALRAAAYEQLTQQGTVLPFFCDDIFETFDEDRTRAACHLMARIGRSGQAIYLTHHRHVVDIAREVCGDGLRVHEI